MNKSPRTPANASSSKKGANNSIKENTAQAGRNVTSPVKKK